MYLLQYPHNNQMMEILLDLTASFSVMERRLSKLIMDVSDIKKNRTIFSIPFTASSTENQMVSAGENFHNPQNVLFGRVGESPPPLQVQHQ